ncbi:hypothetical protein BA93_07465 [Finegoldia magna ALB8]|nr:hypothetical protein BA93_07465 [Finegoldia magna ALB8]
MRKKPDEENKEELDNQDKKADEEAKKEAKKLEAAKADAKSKISIAYKKAEKPEKTLEDYIKAIDEANSEDAIQAIVSEVEGLEQKSEEKKVDEKQGATEAPADEETASEEEKEEVEKDKTQEKTVEEKTEESTDKKDSAHEVGEKIGGEPVQATSEKEKTGENAPGTENALTEVDVKITKKGIGDKPFNFDGVFGQGTKKKVKLINDATGDEQVVEFGSEDELVKYLKKIKMSDVVKNGRPTGNVSIEFEGGNVAGKFTFQESGAKPDSKTGKTLFELTLWQIRNTDIEVKTKNKKGEDVANPTTDQTKGKIESGGKEIDIPSQGEVGVIDEDVEDLLPDEIEDINKRNHNTI